MKTETNVKKYRRRTGIKVKAHERLLVIPNEAEMFKKASRWAATPLYDCIFDSVKVPYRERLLFKEIDQWLAKYRSHSEMRAWQEVGKLFWGWQERFNAYNASSGNWNHYDEDDPVVVQWYRSAPRTWVGKVFQPPVPINPHEGKLLSTHYRDGHGEPAVDVMRTLPNDNRDCDMSMMGKTTLNYLCRIANEKTTKKELSKVMSALGSKKTTAKAAAARENGKKGGRPKKQSR
jgi:hypothetical protein